MYMYGSLDIHCNTLVMDDDIIIGSFQGRKSLLFYLHALGYVVLLVLCYTKLGYFFLQLTKGALLFRMEVS